MDVEVTYWLAIGDGKYKYTAEVSVETYMAMERVCGFREDVRPDQIDRPITDHFMHPGDKNHLKVEGWRGGVRQLISEVPSDA